MRCMAINSFCAMLSNQLDVVNKLQNDRSALGYAQR